MSQLALAQSSLIPWVRHWGLLLDPMGEALGLHAGIQDWQLAVFVAAQLSFGHAPSLQPPYIYNTYVRNPVTQRENILAITSVEHL
jgi:hypothetical protein